MESFVNYWLTWPVVVNFLNANSWGWTLSEILHFVGLTMIVGTVGMFDLRLLGVGKGWAVAPVRELLPWGVVGFLLCVVTGLTFVTGLQANVPNPVYDVLMTDIWLQLKLLALALIGLNLLAFYLTGMSEAVDRVGAGQDAPPLAKAIGAASLVLWIGVIYFGRLIPWAL